MIYFSVTANQFVEIDNETSPIRTVAMVGSAATQADLADVKAAISHSLQTTSKALVEAHEDGDEDDAEEMLTETDMKVLLVDKDFHDSFLQIEKTMGKDAHITPDHVHMVVAMYKQSITP